MPIPPPIRTDSSNAFANNTMRVRLPAIIQQTIDLNPDYAPSIVARLSCLRDAIATGALIQPLEPESADDYAAWLRALNQQRTLIDGDLTWHNSEWFFAETYAYRCLVQAARYHENGLDPFAPQKQAELQGESLWSLLRLATAETDAKTRLRDAFAYALWGNRIDLSYAASLERGTDISADDLLVDERAPLLRYLHANAPLSSVYIVADNAGSELAMDLALTDCLLNGVTERVVIYLKTHPTFVSDATVADAWEMLREMSHRSATASLSRRLSAAWEAGRLRFVPHGFWTSSAFLRDMPGDLLRVLNRAGLIIIKGDANYRRAVGDCLWDAATPFAEVMAYLDAPTLCLRTLKSDPVIGVPDSTTAALDRIDPDWRVNGQRGLIQFKPASHGEA